LQADGIRMGIEAHRRNKPRCMGTLYWQLNDCWPGASWSSIDYFGKWKALHYDVKKAFEPAIISHEFLDSNLNIYVVSDLLVPFDGNIEIILSELGGGKILKKWNKEVSLKANQSAKVLIIDQYELPKAKDKSRLYVQLKLKKKSQIISEKNIFFKPFKNLELQKPNLSYKAIYNNDENSINLKINTDNYAKGVYLTSLGNANFSDNYFDLSSNEEKTIILPVAKNQNYSELIKSIEIISLWDSFN
jgi:beta-mannosidase